MEAGSSAVARGTEATGRGCPDVLERLAGLVQALGSLPTASGDAERIDRIALLESLQAVTAAAQIREISEFHDSQVREQRRLGVLASRLGSGIAEQVALARKVSPATGHRHVVFARALMREMPKTFELLRSGLVSTWVATLVVRETSSLSEPDRARVDSELAAELARMSPRQAELAARRRSYAVDPESPLRRARTSRQDRRVSIRPAPDTMALLTAFAPVEQAVAAYANLDRTARSMKAAGDPRSLGQLRCDLLVERLTGQASADAVPVEIAITMTAESLLGAADIPAQLPGYGPLPASVARLLATGSSASDPRAGSDDLRRARVFVRRIFTEPVSDTVIAVDPRRRRYGAGLARLFRFRDQVCRMAYCDAPIRHHDHPTPYRRGGVTTAEHGQGLCVRDNQVKEMPGWAVRVRLGRPHRTLIATPTGHVYESQAPAALGPGSARGRPPHRARPTAEPGSTGSSLRWIPVDAVPARCTVSHSNICSND